MTICSVEYFETDFIYKTIGSVSKWKVFSKIMVDYET